MTSAASSVPSPTSAATELRESMMAVTRQMRRHRPDHGLTLSQMELLGEVSRTGVTTPAELGTRLHVRVQSLTDSINELGAAGVIARRPDAADRRRQLIEITAAGHRTAGSRPSGARRLVARHHARQPVAARVRPGDARRAGAAQAGIRRRESGHNNRMTRSRTGAAAQEWIAHDPDPRTAAELAACSDDELEQRFAQWLTFGTAGLRGPLRGGPNGMNLAVVLRATWAVAKVLKDRGLQGRDVVVGRDARHGSDEFALAAAEVLAAQGFPVTLMFDRGAHAGAWRSRSAMAEPSRASRSPRRTIRRPTTATRCTSRADSRSCRRSTVRSNRRCATRHTPTRSSAKPSYRQASTRFSATSKERHRFGAHTDRCV